MTIMFTCFNIHLPRSGMQEVLGGWWCPGPPSLLTPHCDTWTWTTIGENQEIHQLEGGVVGAVCEEEDAGHLDGGVALHLLEQGLEVDALGRPEVELRHWTGRLKQTTVWLVRLTYNVSADNEFTIFFTLATDIHDSWGIWLLKVDNIHWILIITTK